MVNQLSSEEASRLIVQDINKDEESRDELRRLQIDMGIKSIMAIRDWAFQIITLSSAILGVSLAIGSNSPMLKHKELLPAALFFFVVTIIFGLYRLKEQIEEDINRLPMTINKYCSSYTRLINAKRKAYIDRTEEAIEESGRVTSEELAKIQSFGKDEGKKSYVFDILFGMFLIGFVFIGFMIRYRYGIIMLSLSLVLLSRIYWQEKRNNNKKGA